MSNSTWIFDAFIVFGIVWIILSFFNFIQNIKVNNLVVKYRDSGSIYFGKNAGFPITKEIILVAAENSIIKKAARLNMAFYMFPAKPVEMPELVGKNILHFETEQPGFPSSTQRAMKDILKNYKKMNGNNTRGKKK